MFSRRLRSAAASDGLLAHRTVGAEHTAMEATVVPHEPAPITATLSSTGRPPYDLSRTRGAGPTLTG